MTMKRKYISGATLPDATLGDRQIRVIASTPTPDRVKDVMVAQGCILENYARNPIVLAQHDPDHPIGTAKAAVAGEQIEALITFAPLGASKKADEYCALAKAGVISTVSIGYEPIEAEPIKGGGYRISSWELLELSLVSVPCNPEAVVTQRSLAKADTAEKWKVGASRNLPIDMDTAWDGPAAEASIFDHCDFDGDDPDVTLARKGFLVYDAANPKLKGSYKLPFAKAVDGRLTALASGIRAAASRLPQSDLPDDVQEKARAVIDHYEEKMKDKSALAIRTKANAVFARKDLYDASQLAYLLQGLASLAFGADWEREYEGDDSPLPEMLAEIARSAGEALIAMTEEETREVIAKLPGAAADGQKAYAGKSGPLRLLRAAAAKSGAIFSAASKTAIGEGLDQIKDGHKAADGHVDDAMKCHKAIKAVVGKCKALHKAMGENEAISDLAAEGLAEIQKNYDAVDGHLDDMRAHHGAAQDGLDDVKAGHKQIKSLVMDTATDSPEASGANAASFAAPSAKSFRDREIEVLRLAADAA
jgi:HK97 family phage prohead protease